MERIEKWKTLIGFGLFGCVVVALIGRLWYLQGMRAAPNRETVRSHRNSSNPLPSSRGDIVDRNGALLAYDRPTLQVRAEFQARVPKGTTRIPADVIDLLASRLASHLSVNAGPDRSRRQLARKLAKRMRAAKHIVMRTRLRQSDYLRTNFLVCAALDSYEAARRLRQEVELWQAEKMPGRLHLRFTMGYRRTYPDREYTMGLIGNHYLAECRVRGRDGKLRTVGYQVASGIEVCRVLWSEPRALEASARPHQIDFKDARRRKFWTGQGPDPEPPSRLHTTLDLELQKLAHVELRGASEAVTKRYKSSYRWGAMVLVDITNGDVLAMASHYPGADGPKPFAPVENAFEPGSVVKPLVIALALERGEIHWRQEFDCSPTLPGRGRPVAGYPRRIIRDDHACGHLTPHGIIVNSSNIGAVQIGVRLGQVGMQDYLRKYGLCEKTGLPVPNEASGSGPDGEDGPNRVEHLGQLSDRMFGRFTGPSLSFGYEVNMTTVQLTRAFMRLLTGEQRELRLVAKIETGGRTLQPRSPLRPQTRFLSRDTVGRVGAAMADVVSEIDHATGRPLYDMIAARGLAQPLIGGKTGTSVSTIGKREVKTAVFVGYGPVHAPRFLVVCVLRKDRAVGFYGGSYAALPAGRLLLGALAQKPSTRAPSERVRAWTGVRGSSSSNRKSGGK